MSENRPFVLSIAGFDPSAGAGVMADIKTLEQIGVYGFGVNSAQTYQNDEFFDRVEWMSYGRIKMQLDLLFSKFKIDVVKIGLIENYSELKRLVEFLKAKNPDVKIVWDPILKSSSGYAFHSGRILGMDFIMDNISVITPNWDEFERLWEGSIDELVASDHTCAWLLKGGHREDKTGTDVFIHKGEAIEISGESFHGQSKHGTGCVLSAAIAGYLAFGNSREEACRLAKKYVEQFILSNPTSLGYHSGINR